VSKAKVMVEAEGVSKKFSRNLRDSVLNGLRDMICVTAGIQRHTDQLRRGEFWALEGLTLSLSRGEILGVIGKNGSGKSTLLSILNGIYHPDTGRVCVRGRVGPLIQVGAGFHPQLTGYENIWVSGSILGMSNREIAACIDEIIEFSGVREYIHMPVKHYSSGMFVRLGFSVVVHMEPDVLLIDEVLSVGDAEFRAKSMERMRELVRSRRVAIVFVSHNMITVGHLCDRVILLDSGRPVAGDRDEIIARYCAGDVSLRLAKLDERHRTELMASSQTLQQLSTREVEILDVHLCGADGKHKDLFSPDNPMRVVLRARATRPLKAVINSVGIYDINGLCLCVERSMFHGVEPFSMDNDTITIEIEFARVGLKAGRYVVGIAFQEPSLEAVYCLRREESFMVVEAMPNPGGKEGFFKPELEWRVRGRVP